jgi:type VI protein secretion system component VasF
MKRQDKNQDGEFGPELEELLGRMPRVKAPAWFAAKTVARMRSEREKVRGWFGLPKWAVLVGGVAVLAVGLLRWESQQNVKVTDSEVFAALDALVEDEKESRWWAGL